MTQEELDAMEISFKYHGFTWNQTNFAVAVIRSHVEPLRQQLAEANRKIEYEQLCASELEQQLDAANTLINKYREETTSLRQQLAETQHSRDVFFDSWEREKQQLAAKQAEVDALMLEYCPSEMSQEQLDNWAAHQRLAKED